MFGEMLKTLTRKEREILIMVHRGLVAKEIALELGISHHTVKKDHMASIYKKLKISGPFKKNIRLRELLNKNIMEGKWALPIC